MTPGEAADIDADESADADGETTNVDADSETATVDTTPPDSDTVIDEVFAVIEARKRDLPEDSYTASLFTHERGENAVLEKLGEETTELVLAAKDDDRQAVAHEGADIVFHLLVLLAMKDMTLEDLRDELRDRR